jgi:hypothetical protein
MEKEQKLYYRGMEIIRVVNRGHYCSGCIGDNQGCKLGASNGYPDDLFYCNTGEIDYVFKFKENVE